MTLPDDALVIAQKGDANDELTPFDAGPYPVFIHWQYFTAGKPDSYLDEQTQTLFVGIGPIAAAVHLPTRTIIDPHEVMLFWAFKPVRGFVLELGEDRVFLRDAHGHIVAKAPVDPPYEYNELAEGIRFESPVYGTQWLRFP